MNETALRQTPLHSLHARLGARFTPFAGYEMPAQFKDGVLKEHLHTRDAAGLFDISHMGALKVVAKNGDMKDAALALEQVAPVDVVNLKAGRQRYAVLTNDAGGVLDDLMIANLGDCFVLVVNAATKEADLAHLQDEIGEDCAIQPMDRLALIALQGPRAEEALSPLAPDIQQMRFMDVRMMEIDGVAMMASRSGYTGEDGFEIAAPIEKVEALCEKLLAQDAVAPIGLGARDSLRLEAGLCLYGADLDTNTTPIEAALEWSIQKARRRGGAREGGFPGDDVILAQLENGAARRRVGLKAEGRAPVRAGAQLYADENGSTPIGVVTSGGFGPTLAAPVAMGYVPAQHATADARLFAEVRGKRLPMIVAATPFAPHRYKRN
ncbi:MAG: glycine cleavage system aminomethyltransferase GcvT [Neomegalonema sp.]|nr:glycine cleavage system aminomethyltransferase GcvT [Neomegalonema sp.]